MPGNVSDIYSATITLAGSAPTIATVTPGEARVGDRVVIDGAGFGDHLTGVDRVLFSDIAADILSWGDTQITCTVPYGTCSGTITVFTDTGSVSSEFHVIPTIDMIVPDYGYNTGVLHIENLEGAGFFAGATVPDVKLTDGPADISATNVVLVSPQSIACDFDLTGAAVGYYSVAVQNEDGSSDILQGCITIDSPPPALTGMTPESGINTEAVEITELAGDNFLDGMRAWLVKGKKEIEAKDVAIASPTRATCTFDIEGAATGKWKVYVRNLDGKEATLSRRFTVLTD
jgi:hypothetical protein